MGKCLFMRKGETHTAPKVEMTPLGDIAVGSTVKLKVNGVATDFLVVNQGIPSNSSLYDSSCNGTWLLMKDLYTNMGWGSSTCDYANSSIHAYLNGEFLGLFDPKVQSAIKQVKIPYVNVNGGKYVASGADGLTAKVFLLGGNEVGSDWYFPADGARLDYFSNATNDTRLAYLNGEASYWWTRSPHGTTFAECIAVQPSGTLYVHGYYNGFSLRPAIILPFEAGVLNNGNIKV